MNHTVRKIIKDLGMQKDFALMMVLRSPFDFLSAVLNANMLNHLSDLWKEERVRVSHGRSGDSLFLPCFYLVTMYPSGRLYPLRRI